MIARDRIDELPRLAPSPPGIAPCSCEEALALRAELAVARARIAELEGAAQPPVALAEPASGDFRVFCPECGVGVCFDEDGCCSQCGASTCTVADVEVHFARVGLRVDRGEGGDGGVPAREGGGCGLG